MVVSEINKVKYEVDSVFILNENIRKVQHTFEILVEAFLHAQDGVIPQLITMVKICNMRQESLPDGLEFPSFSSMELPRIITPIIYCQASYLVYVIQIPLIQSTSFHLCKIQPFPVQQQDKVFVYIESTKDFIFVDAMRQRYGKMNYPELQACFMPNEITFVCKETLPILTYTPQEDCEATHIHPWTTYFAKELCAKNPNYRTYVLDTITYEQWVVVYCS